jgi:hypothetical protein
LAVPDTAGVLDELALAEVEVEVEVEVEAELDELLLHPAASPVQAMAIRATTVALLLAKTGIIPRTLPLIVA